MNQVRDDDFFRDVRPKGWLGRCFKRASNPRKHRWNVYLRACKAIPKDSPVSGSTSWKKINTRRHLLIDKEIASGTRKFGRSAELEALQKVADAVVAPGLVPQNFLLSRMLRRARQLKRKTASA